MKRLVTFLAVIALAISTGCKKEEEKVEPKAGINIELPGGSVKVGEGGVDVQAPGVGVNVDSKKGVGVKAPGVDVKVDTDKGVGVQAPGVDLKVERNSNGE